MKTTFLFKLMSNKLFFKLQREDVNWQLLFVSEIMFLSCIEIYDCSILNQKICHKKSGKSQNLPQMES